MKDENVYPTQEIIVSFFTPMKHGLSFMINFRLISRDGLFFANCAGAFKQLDSICAILDANIPA